MPRKITRSAEDGRFVSRAEAKRNPATTVEETADNFISPQMEAAGALVLRQWLDKTPLLDGDEEGICRDIYKAMRRAR